MSKKHLTYLSLTFCWPYIFTAQPDYFFEEKERIEFIDNYYKKINSLKALNNPIVGITCLFAVLLTFHTFRSNKFLPIDVPSSNNIVKVSSTKIESPLIRSFPDKQKTLLLENEPEKKPSDLNLSNAQSSNKLIDQTIPEVSIDTLTATNIIAQRDPPPERRTNLAQPVDQLKLHLKLLELQIQRLKYASSNESSSEQKSSSGSSSSSP